MSRSRFTPARHGTRSLEIPGCGGLRREELIRVDFRVELTPPDNESEERLRHLLHIGQFEPHSREEAVNDFVETTSNYMAYFGEMVVSEILVDADGDPFRLDPLPPGRVLRMPGRYVQVISARDRAQLGVRRFVPIPADRIWRITLPRSLGGARGHRRLLRRLERLEPMPSFPLQTPDLGQSMGYDFTAFRDACDRLQERATKRWGTVPSIMSLPSTMNAALKSLDAPDATGGDLRAFRPDDASRFGLSVTATIGPAGEPGGELFTFTVCSPDWLATEPLPKAILWFSEAGESGKAGFDPCREARSANEVVRLADWLQEQFFPETRGAWGEARPECPGHSHPAEPVVIEGEGWWVCPGDGRRIAAIGQVGE